MRAPDAASRSTWTSTAHNVVLTWTARVVHTPCASWLGIADALGHKLHLPRWLMRPVCDLYDIEVGIPKEDLIYMDYTHRGKPTPWWLR